MSSVLPGYTAGRTVRPREVLLSREGLIFVPVILDAGGVDGSNAEASEIRGGWLLGRVSASGRFVPCKRTRANGSGSSSTSLVVDVSAPFKVGDTVSIGGGSGVVVNAINHATRTLTLAAGQTWSDNATVASTDGSATCRGILAHTTRLQTLLGTTAFRAASLVIQGLVDVHYILGDLDAVRADSAARVGGLRFSDEHGV